MEPVYPDNDLTDFRDVENPGKITSAVSMNGMYEVVKLSIHPVRIDIVSLV